MKQVCLIRGKYVDCKRVRDEREKDMLHHVYK